MTTTALSIGHIGFLTPGNYPDDDPAGGLEASLKLFEAGEALGYDSAWVRQRHLEHGVSSAPVFLAAASQRTKRIQLGSAVIQLGYESPFRLAEDLSMADSLSGGRLNVGVSAGPPLHAELVAPLVFDGDWRSFDFSYSRVERLVDHLSGHPIGDDETYVVSPRQSPACKVAAFREGLIRPDLVWWRLAAIGRMDRAGGP